MFDRFERTRQTRQYAALTQAATLLYRARTGRWVIHGFGRGCRQSGKPAAAPVKTKLNGVIVTPTPNDRDVLLGYCGPGYWGIVFLGYCVAGVLRSWGQQWS